MLSQIILLRQRRLAFDLGFKQGQFGLLGLDLLPDALDLVPDMLDLPIESLPSAAQRLQARIHEPLLAGVDARQARRVMRFRAARCARQRFGGPAEGGQAVALGQQARLTGIALFQLLQHRGQAGPHDVGVEFHQRIAPPDAGAILDMDPTHDAAFVVLNQARLGLGHHTARGQHRAGDLLRMRKQQQATKHQPHQPQRKPRQTPNLPAETRRHGFRARPPGEGGFSLGRLRHGPVSRASSPSSF